jgi:hypothetical protein
MYKLFTVHDRASDTYIKPFCMETERDAIEGFKEVCKDEKTNYHKYPEDFTLLYLGSYNPRTAEFDLGDKKILINASSFVQ